MGGYPADVPPLILAPENQQGLFTLPLVDITPYLTYCRALWPRLCSPSPPLQTALQSVRRPIITIK